jgi:hypothetical protein
MRDEGRGRKGDREKGSEGDWKLGSSCVSPFVPASVHPFSLIHHSFLGYSGNKGVER